MLRLSAKGGNGGDGQAGGDGGGKGFGSPSGDVQLVIEPMRSNLAQSNISILNSVEHGKYGRGGSGGSRGSGGQTSDTTVYKINREGNFMLRTPSVV